MTSFPNFGERWLYQSFCPIAGNTERAPQLAAPWSPRGELQVTTDPKTGSVSGELRFAPTVKLKVTGTLTAETEGLPEGIELTAEGLGSVSTLRGYFVYGAMVVITGIVLAVQQDLAKQPIGTRGAFLLFPGVG